MHCQMQEPFENRQYVKIIAWFRLHKMIYIGYIITYTPEINKTTMFLHSIWKFYIN